MSQLVQIVGALAILVAYALAQFRVFDGRSHIYLGLNLVGALVLAVIAFIEQLWGFFLLETAWTAVSAWSLAERLKDDFRRKDGPPVEPRPMPAAQRPVRAADQWRGSGEPGGSPGDLIDRDALGRPGTKA
jgi:hypothetical protein